MLGNQSLGGRTGGTPAAIRWQLVLDDSALFQLKSGLAYSRGSAKKYMTDGRLSAPHPRYFTLPQYHSFYAVTRADRLAGHVSTPSLWLAPLFMECLHTAADSRKEAWW